MRASEPELPYVETQPRSATTSNLTPRTRGASSVRALDELLFNMRHYKLGNDYRDMLKFVARFGSILRTTRC